LPNEENVSRLIAFRQSSLPPRAIDFEEGTYGKKTVEKMSEARPPRDYPSEGVQPSAKTSADIGALGKGSTGAGHTTQANQSTSTGPPRRPVSDDFLAKLGEMHDAEEQLAQALFLMEKAAQSEDLKTLLGVHRKETKAHAQTLEAIASSLGKELPDKSCQPVRDLIWEAEKDLAKTTISSRDRDATIIAAGRKAEQFEISAYRPLCEKAEKNHWTHEGALLTSILNQEKLADELLAGLAEGRESLHKLIETASLAHVKGEDEQARRSS
jgi:ferritin-like metal-binding protein YciE